MASNQNDLVGCLEVWNNDPSPDFSFINDKFVCIISPSFIEKIDKCEPFTYIRLGDLEWRIILHNRGNIEHFSSEEIQKRLIDIVTSDKKDNYYVSFSQKLFVTDHVYTLSKAFIENNNISYKFVDNDVFNEMLRYQFSNYMDFLSAIKKKTIVHIGNKQIMNLNTNVFVPYKSIIVQNKNCYSTINDIRIAIQNVIEEYEKNKEIEKLNPLMFFFCCSVTSVILIDEFYQKYGDKYTFVDLGSLFDFFLGYASRTPSICFKEDLFNMYTLCMSVSSVNDIKDISMSFS